MKISNVTMQRLKELFGRYQHVLYEMLGNLPLETIDQFARNGPRVGPALTHKRILLFPCSDGVLAMFGVALGEQRTVSIMRASRVSILEKLNELDTVTLEDPVSGLTASAHKVTFNRGAIDMHAKVKLIVRFIHSRLPSFVGKYSTALLLSWPFVDALDEGAVDELAAKAIEAASVVLRFPRSGDAKALLQEFRQLLDTAEQESLQKFLKDTELSTPRPSRCGRSRNWAMSTSPTLCS